MTPVETIPRLAAVPDASCRQTRRLEENAPPRRILPADHACQASRNPEPVHRQRAFENWLNTIPAGPGLAKEDEVFSAAPPEAGPRRQWPNRSAFVTLSGREVFRSHSVSLRPAVVRREVRAGQYLPAGCAGGQSAGATALYSRGRHQRQRLHLRDAGEHLPRGGMAHRPVHLAASDFVSRADSGQPAMDPGKRRGAIGGRTAAVTPAISSRPPPDIF